ncbi:MAG TPA: 50S ribosomal protein L9 [Patescibacteria group bacterium]|nr:50S ribosomal protein L9 [Patescibacteria group bacterium]
MKVIFLQNVQKLGAVSDVKEVSDGYARNFLIPRKLVLPVTPENMKMLQGREIIRKKRVEKKQKEAQSLVKKLQLQKIVVHKHANKEGKLFAAVHVNDIVSELAKRKYHIDMNMIKIERPMKSLGEYKVTVRNSGRTLGEIAVTVLPENR